MSKRLKPERLTAVRILSLVVLLHAIPVFALQVVSVDPSLPPDTSGLTAFVSVFAIPPAPAGEDAAGARWMSIMAGRAPDGFRVYDAIVAVFHDAGLAPVLSAATEPRIESVLLGVASGGGVALLPAAAAARRTLPGVRIVEVAGANPELEAGIAIHPESSRLGVRSFLHVLEGLVRREHRRAALRPAV